MAEHALEPRAGGALERAESNFTAAKELCRTGHADTEGTTCTYGGMAAANGYWLAAEDCPRNHGGRCDLRAVCDGAEAETGFIGREGAFLVDDWIWRVCACQPCADVYVAAHPEWARKPPGPQMTYEEAVRRLHEQAEADRAAMSPAQREASDMVTNMLLYGQHPAPEDLREYTGFSGLFGLDEPIALKSAVPAERDRRPAQPSEPEFGYILPPATAGDPAWDAMLYGLPAVPPPGSTATGLFDALGGIVPGERADPFEAAVAADELRAGRPVARSQWAPADCACPWPWPLDGRHILTACPHYVAPRKLAVGRNTRIGCQRYDSGTFVHGDPHDCPKWARG